MPPAPEPPIQRAALRPREPSGPASVVRDAPRRKAPTMPPPAPGSAARKALEDKILELRDVIGDPDDLDDPPAPSSRPPGPPSSPPSGRAPGSPPSAGAAGASPSRPRSGQVPLAGKPRAPRTEDPIDLSSIPEADKTKENRGAVGVKRSNSSGSHTANAASGTIGGDTPPPIFDRAAIAAGQKGALATERVSAGVPTTAPPSNGIRTAGTGQNPAVRGTPRPGAFGDHVPHADRPPARSAPPAPVIVDDGLDGLDGLDDDDALGDSLDSLDDLDAALEDRPEVRADVDRSEPAGSPGGPRSTVPLGEFDESQVTVAQDKRRGAYSPATIKRDAPSAPHEQAEPAPTTTRPSPSGGQPAPSGSRPSPSKPPPGASKSPPARALPVAPPSAVNHALPDALIEESSAQLRDDATFEDATRSASGGFDRGDPTIGDSRGDATALSTSTLGHAGAGTLRSAAALPRKRGIAGDMRYVATVVFGIRAAKREMAELATRQATRQQSRRHHLVTLGRTAVALPEWINAGPQAGKARSAPEPAGAEHPALGPAREQLASVEGERSQHAGHILAADAELTRVRRDREAKAKQYLTDLATLDAELASIAKRLEPLDKEATAIKKRAADLRDALRQIGSKIAAAEASLTSSKSEKLDRAQVQAEIASLKADRKAILRDEPVIAEKLDALNPRIAGLEAARAEAHRKRGELETAESDDQRRAEELLTAIGAKRKVVDRAAADAEALRDKILFQLGERLYVDRPDNLTGQLAPLDEIDVELGIADRRMMELREVVSTIDKRKIARGVALIVVLLGALVALVVGVLYLVR